MIKTIRIDIPFSNDKSMEQVLTEKLAQFGLSISDIELKGVKSRNSYNVTSHYGNWCYVSALDIPKLHETDLTLDMPQAILELSDIENLKSGDRVRYQFSNALMWAQENTGRVFSIKLDAEQGLGVIEVSKGKSKSKGYRFYTGDNVMIEKI